MAIEIVDFPIKNGGSFHSYVNVYQRVFFHMLGIMIPTGEVILFGGVGIPPTSMNLGPCLKSCSRCKCNIGFMCFSFKAYLEEKRTWTSTLWLYLFRVDHVFCVISCTYPFLLVNIFYSIPLKSPWIWWLDVQSVGWSAGLKYLDHQ